MDKEIFEQIAREEERTKLFADLAQAAGEVLCKGQDEALCKLRVQTWSVKSGHLMCVLESTAKLKNQEEFLGYFFLGGEKYYFEGKITVTENEFYISLPKEIFHLQRRQNYRVRIPDNYQAFFNIVDVGGKPQKIIGNLRDLSSMGCRVVYKMDSPLMKMNDQVTGHLVIGKRPPIEIAGTVRHIKLDETDRVIQTFGIEFKDISPILENKLFALTMEIHKEVFKRP